MGGVTYPLQQVRSAFPILTTRLAQGHPLIYLDNAATTQKPLPVLEAMEHYYRTEYSNVHRSVHQLSAKSTTRLEDARDYVQQFINARSRTEIIFTKGTTEAINLIAHSWGATHLQAGDEVLISAMEHHANLVPWQLLCQHKGAKLRVIPLQEVGEELDMEVAATWLGPRTKLVALTHVSNALGRINQVKHLIQQAKKRGICVVLDGAQAVPHMAVDVQALDVDVYVFSAHKAYGPMGVGVLYAKEELLTAIPPYQSGGEMIAEVSFSSTKFNELPYKFEAGTPHVAGIHGLHVALKWIKTLEYAQLAAHEDTLLALCTQELQAIPGLRLFAPAGLKVPLCSFVVEGVHAFDIGQLLDAQGIAVRTGHHCAQPLMGCLGVTGCLRVSFACYNSEEEVMRFIHVLHNILDNMR